MSASYSSAAEVYKTGGGSKVRTYTSQTQARPPGNRIPTNTRSNTIRVATTRPTAPKRQDRSTGEPTSAASTVG